MVIFHSYVSHYQRVIWEAFHSPFSKNGSFLPGPVVQDPSSREESVTSIKNLLKGLLDSISSHLDLMTWCSEMMKCFLLEMVNLEQLSSKRVGHSRGVSIQMELLLDQN